MAQGYIRQDVENNISNGTIANADDLNAEFNAIQGSFNNVTGHNHDGTVGGGAPVEVIGPVQNYIASGQNFRPKLDNVYDIGADLSRFKSAWFKDTVHTIDVRSTNRIFAGTGGSAATPRFSFTTADTSGLHFTTNDSLLQLVHTGLSRLNISAAAITAANGAIFTGNGSGLTSIPTTALTGVLNGSAIPSNVVLNTRSITAGDGIAGGGDLSSNRTIAVDGTVVRTSRDILTSDGLQGGGNLSSNRTLSVDNTVVRTSGNQDIGGTKKFSNLVASSGGVGNQLRIERTTGSTNAAIAFNHLSNTAYFGLAQANIFGFGTDSDLATQRKVGIDATNGNISTTGNLSASGTILSLGNNTQNNFNISGNLDINPIGVVSGLGGLRIGRTAGSISRLTLLDAGTTTILIDLDARSGENQSKVVANTFNSTGTIGNAFTAMTNDSAANPAFSWSGDTNTGVFHSATDEVGIAAGGARKLRINTTGVIADTGVVFSGDGSGLTLTNSQIKAANNQTGDAPVYGARAFATIDFSTTPPTILQSKNVASAVRLSTGNFEVTFTTPLSENYCMAGNSIPLTSVGLDPVNSNTTKARIRIVDVNNSADDTNPAYVSLVFFA